MTTLGDIELGQPILQPRAVDSALEKAAVPVAWNANERAKMFEEMEVKDGRFKPREHAEVLTTRSGTFVVQVVMPDGTTVPVTSVTLTVEAGNIGIVGVTIYAGQREEAAAREG